MQVSKKEPTRCTITIKNFNSSITLNPTCFGQVPVGFNVILLLKFLIVIVHLVGSFFDIYKMHGENNIKCYARSVMEKSSNFQSRNIFTEFKKYFKL
jgi:hypothetical protein